jgi:hypothetical protein
MYPQLQEELDYQMGMASELQNAFAVSRMLAAEEGTTQDDPQIEQELAKGKFVVVIQGEVCCPITDALMASPYGFISSHDTREEAEKAALEQDDGYPVFVLPHAPYAPYVLPDVQDGELPF